jgi:hypothetical protein
VFIVGLLRWRTNAGAVGKFHVVAASVDYVAGNWSGLDIGGMVTP